MVTNPRVGRGLGLSLGFCVLASGAVAAAAVPSTPQQQHVPLGQAVDLETGLTIGAVGANVTFRATLRDHATAAPLAGQTITFKVAGALAGTATTDANGLATSPPFIVPNAFGIGDKPIESFFSPTGGYLGASSKNNLDVVKSATRVLCSAELSGYSANHPWQPTDGGTLSCELTRITDNAKLDGRMLHLKMNGSPLKDMTTVSGDIYTTFKVPNASMMTIDVGFDGDALYLPSVGIVKKKVQAAPTPVYIVLAIPPPVTHVGDTVVFTLYAGQKPPVGIGLPPAEPVAGMGLAVVFDSAYSGTSNIGNFGTVYTNSKGVATLTAKMQHAGVGSVRPFLEDEGNGYKYSWANFNNAHQSPFNVERSPLTLSVSGPASGQIGQSLPINVKAVAGSAAVSVPFTSNFGNGQTGTILNVPLTSTMGAGPQKIVVKVAESPDYYNAAASHSFTVAPSQN